MEMRRRDWAAVAVLLLGVISLAGGAALLIKSCGKKTAAPDIITVTDTVRVYVPVARQVTVVRYDTVHYTETVETPVYVKERELRIDTVEKTAIVPITEKTYRDSDYMAVVSGYKPSLDYIETYKKTVYRDVVKWKQPRFSLGVSGGYGYGFTSHQLEPFIGVSLQYHLWNVK